MAGIDAAIEERHRGARPATVRGLQAEGIFRDLPDQKLAQLRQQLLTRQKAIADAEQMRRKRLSELQSIRAEQRATLGRIPIVGRVDAYRPERRRETDTRARCHPQSADRDYFFAALPDLARVHKNSEAHTRRQNRRRQPQLRVGDDRRIAAGRPGLHVAEHRFTGAARRGRVDCGGRGRIRAHEHVNPRPQFVTSVAAD